jgi:hypothetical protein
MNWAPSFASIMYVKYIFQASTMKCVEFFSDLKSYTNKQKGIV